MHDIDLDRPIAENKWQYVRQSIRDMKEMFRWMWQELIDQEGKQISRKMIVFVLLTVVGSVMLPFVTSLIVEGLESRSILTITSSLVGLLVLRFTIQRWCRINSHFIVSVALE